MSDPAYAFDDDGSWTYKDYKEWELKPGERYEIINGFSYAMAVPNTEHQRICTILCAKLHDHLEGKIFQPFAASFNVRLFYEEDESDDTVVRPDLVVVCDPEKLGPEGCRGAPDMAIEILCPSNTETEIQRKLNIYNEAGVPEIWIVNSERKNADVYILENSRYVQNSLKTGDVLKSAKFPALEIPLDLIFNESEM